MPTSQNGWPVIDDYGDGQLVFNPLIPGTGVRLLGGILTGLDGALLLQFAAGFAHSVEELRQELGCWGYERRQISGGGEWSNHASGTAMDLNAVAHPLGVSGTFTPQQVSAIRVLLSAHDGMIRWGGDYSGRVDEMHFELTPTAAGGGGGGEGGGGGTSSYPLPAGYYYGWFSGPTESISGSGRNDAQYRAGLAAAQAVLGVTPDGYYGPDTNAATVAWQRSHGLDPDGLIGPLTWASLGL